MNPRKQFSQWVAQRHQELIDHPLICVGAGASITAGIILWKQDMVVFAVFLWTLLVIALNELRVARNRQQNRVDKIAAELDKSKIAVEQISAELVRYRIVMELMATEIARTMAKELTRPDPKLRNMPRNMGPH